MSIANIFSIVKVTSLKSVALKYGTLISLTLLSVLAYSQDRMQEHDRKYPEDICPQHPGSAFDTSFVLGELERSSLKAVQVYIESARVSHKELTIALDQYCKAFDKEENAEVLLLAGLKFIKVLYVLNKELGPFASINDTFAVSGQESMANAIIHAAILKSDVENLVFQKPD